MRLAVLIVASLICTGFSQVAQAQGFVLPGVGPINRSMGGAGVAAPLDAIGTVHWNPAAMMGLESSRADVAVEALFNRNSVNSGVFVGTPFEVSGSTDSETGATGLPAVGLVHKPKCADYAYGIGLNAIGGFSTNYPGSLTNPLFTPQPPVGVGFGPVFSRLAIVQISPSFAKRVTDRLSVGVAPTINIADAQANPFPFAPPDDSNGDGNATYPVGIGSQNTYGLGVQAGVYYQSEYNLDLGFSVKSPQWFEEFEVNSFSEIGLPRSLTTELEYPLILSFGAAYKATDDWLIALDVRWLDYDSTKLFGDSPTFNADGSLNGLGWESVIQVALGTQLRVTDRLSVRAGYSYNENPIPGRVASLSIVAPGIFQHVFNLGASWKLNDVITLSGTWSRGFHNDISGPILTPLGAIPLSTVEVEQQINSALFGVSASF